MDSSQCNNLNVALKDFLQRCLYKNSSLWSNLDTDERRLRCRCLRDRLCRQAQEKYMQIVKTKYSGSWTACLRTPRGRERIAQWVERKVKSVAGQRATAAGVARSNTGVQPLRQH